MVLRGGYLSGPTSLSGLVEVDGRRYVRLARRSQILCFFLLGKSHSLSPLAGNAVLDKIMALRHDFVKRFSSGIAEDGPSDETVSEDPAAQLGLDADDDEEEGLVPFCGRSRRRVRIVRKTLPSSFEAQLPRPDLPDWCFRMLPERGNKAPAIEATDYNFRTLFELVSTSPAPEGPGAAAKRQPSRRSPRGDRGSREYWIDGKRRWVKVQMEDDVNTGAKKKRTLVRKSSVLLPLELPGPALLSEPLPLEAPAAASSPEGIADTKIGDSDKDDEVDDGEGACAGFSG